MKLSDSVQYLKGVGPRMKEKLERLGIHTVEDLLSYFPRRYQDWTKVTPMGDLVPDEESVVYGEVVSLKEIHPRRSMSILNVMIVDDTGAVVLTYFNQPWKADLFHRSKHVLAYGKVEYGYNRNQISNAEIEAIEEHKRVILVTTHRRENLGAPMHHVYRALRRLVEAVPDTEVVFPVHRNPLVREAVSEELEGVAGIHLVEPMEYEPFTNLMARSAIVLTDSGGIQEEAPSLGKPVLVLRDTTERPEAVEAGTVKLVGTDEEKIFHAAYELLTDEKAYKAMAEAVNPYGDGHSAERIADALLYIEGLSDKKPTKFIAK